MGGERASKQSGVEHQSVAKNNDLEPRPGKATNVETDQPMSGRPNPVAEDAKVAVQIVGHASPRWRRPGSSTRDARNLALSRQRAELVQIELEALLGTTSTVPTVSSSLDDGGGVGFQAEGRGSADTEEEAGGNIEMDAETLRRVDINVEIDRVERGVEHESSSASAIIKTRTPRDGTSVDVREYDATFDWHVRMLTSAGAHMGVGATAAIAYLTNGATGEVATCAFFGKGFGEGFGMKGGDVIPTVDTFDVGTSFRTNYAVTFDDFAGTPARITEASMNGIVGGWSFAYLRFPLLCSEPIDIGGFEQGGLGIGAKIDEGTWEIIDRPRKPDYKRVRRPVTVDVPYTTPVKTMLTHRVHFELEESTLSPLQRQLLEIFANQISIASQGRSRSSP